VVEASGPPPRGSKPSTSTFTPTSTVSLQVQLRETAPRRPNRVGEGHCACQSTAAPSYGPRAIRRASFAAALAGSRRSSAALRSGQTTLPTARRTWTDRRHQSSARGRSASLGSTVASKRRPTASGSEYCASGRAGDAEPGKGITTVAANGKAKSKQYVNHLPGMQFQSYPFTSALAAAAASRIAPWSTPACAVLFKHVPFS